MALADLKKQREAIVSKFTDGKVTAKELLGYQELSYQQTVLETLRAYLLAAKPMAEKGKWELHAKLLNTYCHLIVVERLYDVPESKVLERDAGLEELTNAYIDSMYDFVNTDSPYDYQSPDQYYEDIKKAITIVGNMFQAYRKIYLGK